MSLASDTAAEPPSVALTFGAPEPTLFGWYHPPRATPRDTAVLLCSPAGWEAMATQRTYRELAERLSAAGFACLRFDLNGTGDSVGSDEDPERVQAWICSIEQAATQLRALSRLAQVSFFGIHLGASLAALVAAADGRAPSAVFWAPFVQGKQLTRQIRAYGALNGPAPSAGADNTAGGFLYRADTLDELSAIDLLRLPAAAPRVLLLQHNGSSSEDKLAFAWRTGGAVVTCEAGLGYSEMMQESRSSRVPDQAIDRVVEWLSAEHPPAPAELVTGGVTQMAAGVGGPEVEEELCFFGPRADFFGIVTRPVRPNADLPAIVFLNTSSDYRVGPNRMYVPFSRQLATLGCTSFRFDPAGIGDHRGPRSGDPAEAYSEGRLAEIEGVFDFLHGHGVANRFILVGLCSGAYMAFHAAIRDERVVGTVLINPQTFIWNPGDSLDMKMRQSFGSTDYYVRAIRNAVTWKRALSGRVNVLGIGRTLVRRIAARAFRSAPQASNGFRVDHGFQTLVERGAQVLVVFDENDGGRDVLDGHLGKNGGPLRANRCFRLEIVRGADHTFSRVQDQRTLFDLLRTYVEHWFASGPETSAVHASNDGRRVTPGGPRGPACADAASPPA